jgi:hypothetical protein
MRRVATLVTVAVAALALTAVAFAQSGENRYNVTGDVSPNGKGSKKKPKPVGVEFNYTVDGPDDNTEPAAVKRYRISFYGVRSNGRFFRSCPFSRISNAGTDEDCPRAAIVGTGVVENVVYPTGSPGAPRCTGTEPPGTLCSFPCRKDLRVYNSGQGKATLYLYGPAEDCGGIGAPQFIDARYVKESGGGTALQFDVPPNILHTVPSITLAVRRVQSEIARRSVRRKGKRRGYYESVNCRGKQRPITVSFTAEAEGGADGPVTRESINVPC